VKNLAQQVVLPQKKRWLVKVININLSYIDVTAMLKRSKKQDNTMMQYYLVIGAFVAVCVAAVVYVLLNPKKSFSQMPVIEPS